MRYFRGKHTVKYLDPNIIWFFGRSSLLRKYLLSGEINAVVLLQILRAQKFCMRVNSFLWPEAILQLLYVITDSSSSSTVSSAKTIGNGHLRPNSGSHHNRDQQPDLVKVSSPKLSELVRLESVVDAKTQENAQLRARLGHNAKGFEALAITVNQYAKKVRKKPRKITSNENQHAIIFCVIFGRKI